ncbi:Oxysterol-binding protein 3 [Microbotryomycetes sp. JL201]|nr:Oxysterol-binding protein 3 [Microbotryomycetes sp. JL201]
MADEGQQPLKAADAVMQGYMLKKKRKKMQGMARRYFWLAPSGALSYSFHPNSPIRDSIFVNLAFVSASRKSRTFHIDSGKTVYHCKAMSVEDFDKWTQALKAFSGNVVERGTGTTNPQQHSSSQAAGTSGAIDLAGIAAAVSKMSSAISDLEALQLDLKQSLDPTSPNSGPSPGSKLKFFKKHPKDSSSTTRSASGDDYFEPKPYLGGDAALKSYATAVATLRQQHDLLQSAVRSLPQQSQHVNTFNQPPTSPARTYASRSSAAFAASRASSIDDQDFYDAVGGEFVLDEDMTSEDDVSTPGDSGFHPTEDDEEAEDDDEDDDDESADENSAETSPERERKKESSKSKGKGDIPDKDVKRRSKLPAPAGQELSMIGLLRKNVGKDLSQISFPVSMNEPLSALQRIAEEMEYSRLLDQAAETQDSLERLALVAVWAVSGFSGNKYRSSRKPFNPLLGETYECVRPDKGFKFIAEKVSHNPVIMAFHSESKQWSFDGHLEPTQKFWGRSMEVFVSGDTRVTVGEDGDVYNIKKPSSFVRNLVAGTKYLEVVGDMTVMNEKTGEKAVVSFKEGSSWGGASTRNKIEGKVLDSNGSTKIELVGRWDEHVDKKEGGSKFERLWEINEFPPNPDKYYGFTTFGTQLNEITELEKGKMAPSDSRLRPDQSAMEASFSRRGDIDNAEELKKKLEEKQRAKRKKAQDEGRDPANPLWFAKEGNGWKYGGQYSQMGWWPTLSRAGDAPEPSLQQPSPASYSAPVARTFEQLVQEEIPVQRASVAMQGGPPTVELGRAALTCMASVVAALGNQARALYRYGHALDCTPKFEDFKFCMSIKSLPDDQKERVWVQRRAEMWAHRRLGPSSEDVWTARTGVYEQTQSEKDSAVAARLDN